MSYKIFQVFGNYGVSVDGKIELDDCSVAYEDGDNYSSELTELRNPHDSNTQEWYEFRYDVKLPIFFGGKKCFGKKNTLLQ